MNSILKKLVALCVVSNVACSILLAANEGEECIVRPLTLPVSMPPGCATAPHPTLPSPAFICTGFCRRFNWTGSCHDCLPYGNSQCYKPTGTCTRVTEQSPCAPDVFMTYPFVGCSCTPPFGTGMTWTVLPGSATPSVDSCS